MQVVAELHACIIEDPTACCKAFELGLQPAAAELLTRRLEAADEEAALQPESGEGAAALCGGAAGCWNGKAGVQH